MHDACGVPPPPPPGGRVARWSKTWPPKTLWHTDLQMIRNVQFISQQQLYVLHSRSNRTSDKFLWQARYDISSHRVRAESTWRKTVKCLQKFCCTQSKSACRWVRKGTLPESIETHARQLVVPVVMSLWIVVHTAQWRRRIFICRQAHGSLEISNTTTRVGGKTVEEGHPVDHWKAWANLARLANSWKFDWPLYPG